MRVLLRRIPSAAVPVDLYEWAGRQFVNKAEQTRQDFRSRVQATSASWERPEIVFCTY